MRKVKSILRVIATMDPKAGGPGQGIRNSIPEMEKLGVINEVLCFDSGEEDYCGTDIFTIHYLGPSRTPYQYVSGLSSWLFENFKRFDVVIIHGLWIYNSWGTYRVWEKYKKTKKSYPKLYIMPHGMLDPYFQKAPERRLKAIRNRILWRVIENKIINRVSGVLFTCQKELELARETFQNYSPNLELNVSYGILPPPEYNNKMSLLFDNNFSYLSNNRYMLFLSRVHGKKGIENLLNAYNLFSENYSTDENEILDLVIAGPIQDEKYAFKLKNIASGNKRIHFVGMMRGDYKWALLYNCSCFILPSHQENFGIAIVEALACSKAVLISDKVNIYKEILNGKAGFVEKDEIEGTRILLEKWNNLNNQERIEIGDNGRSLFLEKFSSNKAAKMLIDKLEVNS